MKVTRYTSAGRLFSEATRVKELLLTEPNNSKRQFISHRLDELFASGSSDWTRGLAAYNRLIIRAQSDVKFTLEDKQPKFLAAIKNASQVTEPGRFHSSAKDFANQILDSQMFERLEWMDEKLQAVNQCFDLDEERALSVIADIDAIIEELGAGAESGIDPFIINSLKDVRASLELYALYGPEGVDAAIAITIGTMIMKPPAIPSAKEVIKRIGGVLTKAREVVDYIGTGKEALGYAGDVVELIESAI